MLYPGGYKISHAEQSIGADKATADAAGYLEYKIGAPV
jgi:DNA-binding GntR family transcriptional regulator